MILGRRPKVLSYGGGLDSFALLVAMTLEGEPPDVCIFIDVGDLEGLDPAEWPGTYRHIREVVMPFCELHGIEFIWLDTTRYPVRDARSLFAWMKARRQIPVAGPNRICTIIAKVERFERWMDDRFPDTDVEVWIGFEAGEEKRVDKDPNAGTGRATKPGQARRHNRFPLVERGYCRCRCEKMIRALGFPVPRKSACQFCPYGSLTDWKTYAREDPASFALTVALEADKPPTKAGRKLSIMGYKTKKDAAGNFVSYRAPALPIYIQGQPQARRKSCTVCGAALRATKATGCGYLDEAVA